MLVFEEKFHLDETGFVEMAAWLVPHPLSGSRHRFKYRLAYVEKDVCVIRYDNEAGKGDHRHIGRRETDYTFTDLDTLLVDFWSDVDEWRRR